MSIDEWNECKNVKDNIIFPWSFRWELLHHWHEPKIHEKLCSRENVPTIHLFWLRRQWATKVIVWSEKERNPSHLMSNDRNLIQTPHKTIQTRHDYLHFDVWIGMEFRVLLLLLGKECLTIGTSNMIATIKCNNRHTVHTAHSRSVSSHRNLYDTKHNFQSNPNKNVLRRNSHALMSKRFMCKY